MPNLVGSGDYRYEVIEDWAKLPDGWNAPMAAVAIDSQDRVYGFNRGEHRVTVFDRDGNFLSSWGEGKFPFPHAIYADPHDNILDRRGAEEPRVEWDSVHRWQELQPIRTVPDARRSLPTQGTAADCCFGGSSS